MDSLELKVPANELDVHLAKIRHISNRDKEVFRKTKENKATQQQRTITANAKEKKFSVTYYREQYERNKTRVHSKKGKYMK
ncbi:hypothetical protein [Aquimarina rhabdastrellae]